MIVSIIVAASENNVIGNNNDLIWSFPNDMSFFKQKTLNHHVIMGRKNFESIPHKFKPLPNRTNIVITRNLSYDAEGAVVVNSLSQAIKFSRKEKQKETFVIGGGQIYDLSLKENLIDRIYLTRIHKYYEGDTFFPILGNEWKVKEERKFHSDEKHESNYTFFTYEK